MSLLQNPLRIAATLATAMMATMVLFTATAGHARGNTVVYTAQIAEPLQPSTHITKGTVIRCAGTECKGAKSSSSTRTICAKIADKVGPVASFSYKGEAIDADALAKCNN